jgi:hypothetical protein
VHGYPFHEYSGYLAVTYAINKIDDDWLTVEIVKPPSEASWVFPTDKLKLNADRGIFCSARFVQLSRPTGGYTCWYVQLACRFRLTVHPAVQIVADM